ncbi:MAG: ABC transporter substrate-binding protein [Cellulosilyticaceae bacterium]
MKLKKIMAGIAVTTIALGTVGCGSNKEAGATSTAAEQGKEGTVKLKAHFIGAAPTDLAQVQEEINKYTKEKIGAELEIVFTDFGDYDQKTQMIINSGEDYDLIFTCAWANDYLGNARKGAFLDLTSYLQDDKYKELNNVIDPAFWEGAKVDGQIYAVPTQKEIAIMPMYLVNQELAEKYKFDYTKVKALKDFEPYLKQIKENEGTVIPFNLFSDRAYRGPYDYILGYDYPIAVQIEGENKGKVVNMYELPEVRDYVTTVRDFFQKGYINQDAATKSGTMKKGEIFGLSMADGQPYAEVTWSNDSGFKIGATNVCDPVVTTSSTRGGMMAINKNSKNGEKALEFIQLLNTDSKLHNIVNYGIEGTHFNVVGENQIKRTEQGNNGYLVPSFGLGNLFNTYTLEGEPLDKWEVFQKENDEALRSPLLGLDIDTTNIANELAAISNLRLQYEPLIQTGAVETEKAIAEFNKKLDEVGLQKVIQEVQKQVDAFLAK